MMHFGKRIKITMIDKKEKIFKGNAFSVACDVYHPNSGFKIVGIYVGSLLVEYFYMEDVSIIEEYEYKKSDQL